MQLPIQYKLWNNQLYVRSGANEEWLSIRTVKSKVFTPVTQWFGNDFKYTKDTPVGWKDKWFYKEIIGGIDGHNGIDMIAPTGTCLYAPEAGTIVKAYQSSSGSKNILLKTKERTHYFFHLADFNVAEGDKVIEGQLIGLCDNTGLYTLGSHLHLGVAPKNINTNNGHNGFINFSDLVDFNIIKLPYQEGDLLQRIDTNNGGAGQVYVVQDGMLKFLDSQKQLDKHIPLVDYVLRLLKSGIEPNKLKGINEQEFNKYKHLLLI